MEEVVVTGHSSGCVTRERGVGEGSWMMTRWRVVKATGTSRCRARNSGLQHSSTVSRGLARFSTKPVRTVASSVGLSFPVQIAFERAMRRRTVVKKPTSHSS